MQEWQFENFGACRELKFRRARSLKRSRGSAKFFQRLPLRVKNGPDGSETPLPLYADQR